MAMILGDYITRREPFPDGLHLAICYAVVDLGTQEKTEFKGTGKYWARQTAIIWEFPNLMVDIEGEDGAIRKMPKARRQFYSNSLSNKGNLRKHLSSWLGRGLEPEDMKKIDLHGELINRAAQIQIIHEPTDDGGKRDKMSSITPVMQGMPIPKMVNLPLAYAYDVANNVWPEFPENMPDWVKNTIYSSREWIELEKKKKATETSQPEAQSVNNPAAQIIQSATSSGASQ